jgi:hypothetical protein
VETVGLVLQVQRAQLTQVAVAVVLVLGQLRVAQAVQVTQELLIGHKES